MKKFRILIATNAPISANFGAGQMAINLAEALREQGHEVILWSPHPMQNLTRWWQGFQRIQLVRSKLDRFIATQDKFDIIDASSELITKQIAKSGLVVARSVQPQLLYMLCDLKDSLKKDLKKILLLPFNCLLSIFLTYLVIQGWRRASYILCLGTLELGWMKKWFPCWESKLIYYVNALSKTDQVKLANIRRNRKNSQRESIKFLWIGRWVPHKGIHELLNFIIDRMQSQPQDTFTIAGCGTNAEQNFSTELIHSGKVTIVPFFNRQELYSLLASHDVGLFTSKVEGWGLVLNEMLESGMPIFATRAGGVVDLQTLFDKMLMLFPPSPKLTNNILTYEFPDDYYKLFTWEKIGEKYLNQISSHVK